MSWLPLPQSSASGAEFNVYTSIWFPADDRFIVLLSFSDSGLYPFHPADRSPVSIWAGGTHLHADDGVDEEQHGNEEAHVGQRLETHEHISSGASLRLHRPNSTPLTTEPFGSKGPRLLLCDLRAEAYLRVIQALVK